ncbi:hypothetical protein LPJ66_006479 [Kickxella alabastrina]|uniref:Uncharacterized protein n=1 Tax=Kickxella alabastrina TaxID=61397 RepID=A0ACC1IHP0_9FUNG|nr:hypothetical protein LPJ66_006479 [Kickxella alabastrina]
MSYKCYLGEVLCIVYSEIAYFRYLFPKSYFETVCLVDVVSHRLIKGKSLESDQLLANIDGICDALSKNFIKTLVVGISINALRPTFIRELYAFQFNANTGSPTKAPSKRQSANDTATTELFLNRLVALLHEMEVGHFNSSNDIVHFYVSLLLDY